MKMRYQKHYQQARTGWKLYFLQQHEAARPVVTHAEVQAFKQEYICVKVSTGEQVSVHNTLMGAKELVDKHMRQKRARLQVLDTATNELVLFEQEATA